MLACRLLRKVRGNSADDGIYVVPPDVEMSNKPCLTAYLREDAVSLSHPSSGAQSGSGIRANTMLVAWDRTSIRPASASLSARCAAFEWSCSRRSTLCSSAYRQPAGECRTGASRRRGPCASAAHARPVTGCRPGPNRPEHQAPSRNKSTRCRTVQRVSDPTARRDRGIAHARPIEMRRQTAAARQGDSLAHVVLRQHASIRGVFERQKARAREMKIDRLDRRGDSCSGSVPSGAFAIGCGWIPPSTARPATFVPIGVRSLPDKVFVAAVAVGHKRSQIALRAARKKSDASLPARSATTACRRNTVGSSPQTSSPTSAPAIAARIDWLGRVTVSLRKSITLRLGQHGRLPPLLPLQAQATFRSMTVVINGRDDFTLENYRRVSEGGEPVAIGPHAREAMAAARADFIRLLESDRTQFIYGVTSSLGPRAKVTIPPEQQRAHARAFEFRGNWARGFGGGYLDERVVRGIIFARLANFVAGNSKARPVVAERLAALLDGPLPPVPLDGEVGAGEVLPLAHVLRGFRLDDDRGGRGQPGDQRIPGVGRAGRGRRAAGRPQARARRASAGAVGGGVRRPGRRLCRGAR